MTSLLPTYMLLFSALTSASVTEGGAPSHRLSLCESVSVCLSSSLRLGFLTSELCLPYQIGSFSRVGSVSPPSDCTAQTSASHISRQGSLGPRTPAKFWNQVLLKEEGRGRGAWQGSSTTLLRTSAYVTKSPLNIYQRPEGPWGLTVGVFYACHLSPRLGLAASQRDVVAWNCD